MEFSNLKECIYKIREELYTNGKIVKTQDWQGLQENFEFLELTAVNFTVQMPETLLECRDLCEPFWPWAEDHFQERVSGLPLNPPPSHKYWLKGNEEFKSGEKGEVFSHSYPERFWPKTLMPKGYRYETGDLEDLIQLLIKNPSSRQAYLPIYFPEDLGASKLNERVPCTLGYHIYIRDNKVNIFYPMRSCDAIRHFHNDMYLTVRLAQYIRDRINIALKVKYNVNYKMGILHFACSSLHCFSNDRYALKKLLKK
jgi:thymidylate synthase